jgi:hypothetical protein
MANRDRQWFIDGVQVYEEGDEEWFTNGIQLCEDQAPIITYYYVLAGCILEGCH